MRSKTRGGRARVLKSASPSRVATTRSLHFFNHEPDKANGEIGLGWMARGTSGKLKDGVDVAFVHSEYEADVRMGNLSVTSPDGDLMDADSLEEEPCIKCSRHDGKMLICGQSGCPISVHENCMNSDVKFDDAGNFCCPYCWYKHELARARELRKKALETKKQLACFLDSKTSDGNKEDKGRTDKGKEVNKSSLFEESNKGDGDTEDSTDSDLVEKTSPEEEKKEKDDNEENGRWDKGKELNKPSSFGESNKDDGGSEDRVDSVQFEIRSLEEKEGEKGDKEETGRTDEGKELSKSFVFEESSKGDGDSEDSLDSGQVDTKSPEEEEELENLQDHSEPAGSNGIVSHEKTPVVGSLVNSISRERPDDGTMSDTYKHGFLQDGQKILVDDLGQADNIGDQEIVEDHLQEVPHSTCYVQEENGNALLCVSEKHIGRSKEGRREDDDIDPRMLHTETTAIYVEPLSVHPMSDRGRRKKALDSPKNLSSPKGANPKNAQSKDVGSSKNLSSPKDAIQEKVVRAPIDKATASKKSTQVSDRNSTFVAEKRRRLFWTAEEEEMLKEGVQKISTIVKKNLPWRKVLEFGSNIFDPTRTPSDLKDKWRSMTKESPGSNRA